MSDDYVRHITMEVVDFTDDELHNQIETFAEDNVKLMTEVKKLREILERVRGLWKGTICMPDSQEQIRDILNDIDNILKGETR